MELRTLRYFLAVAGEENITKAADILHVTQPTLSRQMIDLEKELGTTLMLRGKSRLTLTDDGIFFRQRAEEIVELADRLEQSFAQKNTQVSGQIAVGASEAVGSRLLAKLIKQFSEKYPLVQFHLYNEMADNIKDRLDKGLLDFGVLLGDMDKLKYHYLELPVKDIWGVLMRRDSPLAGQDTVSPRDLRDKPLILSRQTDNKSDLYRWLGKEPEQLHTVATYNLIYNASLMVDEGMGYAFTLDKLVNTMGSNLCFRPLEPKLELGMYLVWKKSQMFSKAAEVFLDCLQEGLLRKE